MRAILHETVMLGLRDHHEGLLDDGAHRRRSFHPRHRHEVRPQKHLHEHRRSARKWWVSR